METLWSIICNVMLQWFPTFGNLGILGLQLPKAFTISCTGCGFWELQSKSTWVIQGWEPLLYRQNMHGSWFKKWFMFQK